MRPWHAIVMGLAGGAFCLVSYFLAYCVTPLPLIMVAGPVVLVWGLFDWGHELFMVLFTAVLFVAYGVALCAVLPRNRWRAFVVICGFHVICALAVCVKWLR